MNKVLFKCYSFRIDPKKNFYYSYSFKKQILKFEFNFLIKFVEIIKN